MLALSQEPTEAKGRELTEELQRQIGRGTTPPKKIANLSKQRDKVCFKTNEAGSEAHLHIRENA